MQIDHQTLQGHQHGHTVAHVQAVEIHVNEKPVRMIGHQHNGFEIKEAAIEQHVKIQRDFLLYLLRHHQPNLPIGDDEGVTLTHESRFHAIADDDNS